MSKIISLLAALKELAIVFGLSRQDAIMCGVLCFIILCFFVYLAIDFVSIVREFIGK